MTEAGVDGDADAMVLRVRRRALVLAVLAIVGAFVAGWRSGVSLTICAAVVILSFLVLEKLTDRLVPRQKKPRWRVLLPLLFVTVASFVLLGAVLWRWKGFDPVAGAFGLSVVVLSVVPEAWRR
jgi:hypothetical protein